MHLVELAPHPCSGPTSFSFSQTRVDDFSASLKKKKKMNIDATRKTDIKMCD